VVAGIWQQERRVLLSQRLPHKRFAGEWEFPGGKIEPSETGQQALRREWQEELGVRVIRSDYLYSVRHQGTHQMVCIEVHRVTQLDSEPINRHTHAAVGLEGQRVGLFALNQLLTLPILQADQPILMSLILPDVFRRAHSVEALLSHAEAVAWIVPQGLSLPLDYCIAKHVLVFTESAGILSLHPQLQPHWPGLGHGCLAAAAVANPMGPQPAWQFRVHAERAKRSDPIVDGVWDCWLDAGN
jgi:mutator protein MutT